MSFGNPQYLWLLLATPLLILWARRGRRLRTRAWRTLERWGRPSGERSIAILAAVALMIVALAQPKFGGLPDTPLGPGQDVVLVFDVSRSMAAEDATPNRLALAVETAKSLVRVLARQPSDRAAVVAFAGRGVLRCPLTQNMGAAVDAMERLRPGGVQPGGTNLGAALDAAREAFDPNEPTEGRTVVVLSDGEDHEGRWNAPLERLIQSGVIVHTIALGDPTEGGRVPSSVPGKPLEYQGEPVVSKRHDEALEAIAERSGGASLKLGLATADLGLLYQDRIAPVARARRLAARAADRPERFPIFLAAALGFLLVGCRPDGRIGPLRWFSKRSVGVATLAAVAVVQLGAAVDDPPGAVPKAGSAAVAVVRGQSAYAAGRFDEALAAFESASSLAPNRPVPYYNTGACLFQMGRFAEAIDAYQRARERADAGLRTKIDYALGNALLCLGDLNGAVRAYDECVASTARGPGLDAVRSDAAVNRQFAIEKLQSALAQEKEDEPERGPSQKQKNRPSPPRQSDAREDDGPGDSTSGEGRGDEGDQDSGRPRNSKVGGAGGASRRPPGTSDTPPGDRLDAAVDQIREAQSRRIPEEPPADESRTDHKDW
jgi:Ca-activated chloride channel homolog